MNKLFCADCGTEILNPVRGPKDGWQFEDGRTVCHDCCVVDFGIIVNKVRELAKKHPLIN